MRQINSLQPVFTAVRSSDPALAWTRSWASPVADVPYLAGELHPEGGDCCDVLSHVYTCIMFDLCIQLAWTYAWASPVADVPYLAAELHRKSGTCNLVEGNQWIACWLNLFAKLVGGQSGAPAAIYS
jgi:hypothetical protein